MGSVTATYTGDENYAAYSLTGGSKRYYKEIKKNIFIDKWEDIQDYSLVRVINREISTAVLKELNNIKSNLQKIKNL